MPSPCGPNPNANQERYRYRALRVAPPPDGHQAFAAREVTHGGHHATPVPLDPSTYHGASPEVAPEGVRAAGALPPRAAQLKPPVADPPREFVLGSIF